MTLALHTAASQTRRTAPITNPNGSAEKENGHKPIDAVPTSTSNTESEVTTKQGVDEYDALERYFDLEEQFFDGRPGFSEKPRSVYSKPRNKRGTDEKDRGQPKPRQKPKWPRQVNRPYNRRDLQLLGRYGMDVIKPLPTVESMARD